MSTIRDKILDPFYIKKDQYCYTVMEIVTPTQSRREEAKGPRKDYEQTISHHATLDACLEKIGKEKLNSKGSEYKSIQEYIESYREILNEMQNLTKNLV